ncbi:hypothetical protein Tco_0447050, partial [Tanacetum coccineum]
ALKLFVQGNPEEDLKDYAIIDSGCSGRISGKGTIKTSCLDFEKIKKNDVYSLDLKNIIPSGGITCLVAKATEDCWQNFEDLPIKMLKQIVYKILLKG